MSTRSSAGLQSETVDNGTWRDTSTRQWWRPATWEIQIGKQSHHPFVALAGLGAYHSLCRAREVLRKGDWWRYDSECAG
jgi:hypothetical protein